MVDWAAEMVYAGGWGGLAALLVGVAVGLSPVAWPAAAAVMSAVTPADAATAPARGSVDRHVPSIVAFTAGMHLPVAAAGYLFVSVTVAVIRSQVVLAVFSGAVLCLFGLTLLSRRASLCRRSGAMPPRPVAALAAGALFSVGGCPGCAPIALTVGAAAALSGGPVAAVVLVSAFVVGHAAVLAVAAAAAGRLLRSGRALSWVRLDLVVGTLAVAAGVYQLWAVATGRVSSALPGAPGSGVLP